MEIKTRAPNFTMNEVETLIDLLYARPDLASGRIGTNYPSQLELTKGWEYITEIVNEVGTGYKRSAKDVKKKWKDLKFNTKKKANNLKEYRNITGKDPPVQEGLTDLEQKIIGLINKCQSSNNCQTGFSSENSDNENSENAGDFLDIKIEQVGSLEDHVKKSNCEPSVQRVKSTGRVKAYRDRERMKREEGKNDVIKELIQLNSQVLKYLEKSNNIKYSMLQEMKLSNKLKVAELKIKCKIYNLDLNVINAD